MVYYKIQVKSADVIFYLIMIPLLLCCYIKLRNIEGIEARSAIQQQQQQQQDHVAQSETKKDE